MDEAQVISEQMAHIRQNMDHRVDVVVENAREMVDWRQFVRHNPWIIFGASVAAGYMLIPRKAKSLRPETLAVAEMMEGRPLDAKVKVKPRRRILGTAASLVGTAILRTALAAATTHATQWMQNQEALRQAAQSHARD